MELFSDSSLESYKLLFVGVIPLLCLIHDATSIRNRVISPIELFLRQYSS